MYPTGSLSPRNDSASIPGNKALVGNTNFLTTASDVNPPTVAITISK